MERLEQRKLDHDYRWLEQHGERHSQLQRGGQHWRSTHGHAEGGRHNCDHFAKLRHDYQSVKPHPHLVRRDRQCQCLVNQWLLLDSHEQCVVDSNHGRRER